MTDFTPLIVCLPMIIIFVIIYYRSSLKKGIKNCRKRKNTHYIIVPDHTVYNDEQYNNEYIPLPIPPRYDNNYRITLKLRPDVLTV